MTMTIDLGALYRARAGRVDFVDVPELGYVVVDGSGAPDGPEFAAALQALFPVSYGAHFAHRKRTGDAPKVMPLEALWWVDGDPAQWLHADRSDWHWRALIAQPDPIDAADVVTATAQARAKHPGPALDRVRFVRWEEGRAAQVLHVGPYSAEGATIELLHDAIAAAGLVPRGHHHEIYLGDPRRCAPERLRTILRQPVADKD